MNIIEQASTKLKFEDHNQQWFWGILFAIPLVAAGFGIAAVSGNVITLECQRINPIQMTCQRTIVGLLGTKTTLIPGQLKAAYVRKTQATGVVLETTEGGVTLGNYRMLVGEEQQQLADEINAFINNPHQPSLKIQQDDRLGEFFIMGIGFFVVGITVILTAWNIPMQTLCDLDKISGQMTLEKQYRLFGTKFTTQRKLTEIRQAQVTQLSNSDRNPVYLVRLELTSAKLISLFPPTRDRQQCQNIVDTLNQFLRLRGV